jgi:hypothetical protein
MERLSTFARRKHDPEEMRIVVLREELARLTERRPDLGSVALDSIKVEPLTDEHGVFRIGRRNCVPSNSSVFAKSGMTTEVRVQPVPSALSFRNWYAARSVLAIPAISVWASLYQVIGDRLQVRQFRSQE